MDPLTRRELLAGLSAGLAAAALPSRLARALEPPGDGLGFVFVFAPGGWDPLTVFAPLFGNPSIDMEMEAEVATVGGIRIVDHPDRPGVRAFFERWGARTVLLNGLSVRSVSHDTCTLLALTGSSAGNDPDWATRLAAARAAAYTLPHLVLSGPSYPADEGGAVARSGMSGQLDRLLSGAIVDESDAPGRRPRPASERILDRYLARRTAARADGAKGVRDGVLTRGLHASLDRAAALKDLRFDVDLMPGMTLSAQADAAVAALARGLSRCVTLSHPASWDTHANNEQQSALFEDLFQGLSRLMSLLEMRRLLDRTMVVVLSEMGRTPRFNGAAGRDHWPYTSALLVGPGLTGGRVVGAWDEGYRGLGVEPQSAEVAEGAPALGVLTLGATLLHLGDVDPAAALPGAAPLAGILG